MRDLLEDHRRLAKLGTQVGRAVVVSVWGSAPRPPGACMLATATHEIAGSVSGGCVEGATAEEIAGAIETGRSKVLEFGVSDRDAWSVGLSCGGKIRILVQPSVDPKVMERLERDTGFAIATVIDDRALGTAWIIEEDGTVRGSPGPEPDPPGIWSPAAVSLIRDAALAALEARGSAPRVLELPGWGELEVFLEAHPPRAKLVIYGGVHVAQELVPLAQMLGYHVTVADGRTAFATPERFPSADRLIQAWPEEAFGQLMLDSNTYVCVLTHDPKFDDPALQIALKSRAPYVGALGSRKTQGKRRDRLAAMGLTEDEMSRLRGPIGLELGSRVPADIALAILAEITAVRHGGAAARRS